MRCKKCNCKSSFFLKCRCGYQYCSKHILPEIHKCNEIDLFRKDAYVKNKKILIEASQKEKVEWAM